MIVGLLAAYIERRGERLGKTHTCSTKAEKAYLYKMLQSYGYPGDQREDEPLTI